MKNFVIVISLLLAVTFAVAYFTKKSDIPEYIPDPRIKELEEKLRGYELISDSLQLLADKHLQRAEYWRNKQKETEKETNEKLENLYSLSNTDHLQLFNQWSR
jgi:hypothetical protein